MSQSNAVEVPVVDSEAEHKAKVAKVKDQIIAVSNSNGLPKPLVIVTGKQLELQLHLIETLVK